MKFKGNYSRRERLLALGWPTSAELGHRMELLDDPGQWAKAHRDAGHLLGVWDPVVKTFRYPDWQFDAQGTPLREMTTLLFALAENPRYTAQADEDGWRRAYWLYQPRRSLSQEALAARANPINFMQPAAIVARLLFESLDTSTRTDDFIKARTPADVFLEAGDVVISLARQDALFVKGLIDADGNTLPPTLDN